MIDRITLTARATFDDASGTDALPRRMRGIAYSGGRAPDRNLVIDLSTTKVNVPAPLLADHWNESTQAVGRITAASVGSTLTIEGELYVDVDDKARVISEKAKRGHPWELSVGLYGFTWDEVPPGKNVTVNGRSFDGPITVLREGTVREVSIVALGADPDTEASFFSNTNPKDTTTMADATAVAQLATLTVERDQARTQLAALQTSETAARARVTELEAEVAALRGRAETAEREQRTADVRTLLSALSIEFSDDAAKPYLAMDAVTFAAVKAQLSAVVVPKLPAHLSQSFADGAAGQSGAQGSAQSGGLLLATVRAAHGIK